MLLPLWYCEYKGSFFHILIVNIVYRVLAMCLCVGNMCFSGGISI